jgi:protoporphyrinogen oxidase
MSEMHVVIGAGPAGLTAAWMLSKLGKDTIILESDPRYVGGIARTVEYKGNRFDMGGHRFYSKSDEINRLWEEMLPSGFIQVPRLSRIFYDQKFIPYPIEARATLRSLGFLRSLKIGMSYLRARLFPRRPEISFEDWIVNRFGYDLYVTFFKTYTEKVWGIPCTSINKDWAAQRIRGLTLFEAIKNALFPPKANSNIKTLIKTFTYPRLGPGQLWESVCDRVLANGGRLELDKTVVRMNHRDGVMRSVETQDGCTYEGSHYYITMTLRDFIDSLDPPPPPEVLRAAHSLVYRDFMTVALVVDRADLFPDNWIYIHDPGVHVGRVQNYKNWSKDMVADPSTTCLGMEYFCNQGDALWEMDDTDLIAMAAQEVERIGLAKASECVDGCVVRLVMTYPVYEGDYKTHRKIIKSWMNSYFKNVYPAGRGGLHNYNSQDHSMMAAILAVRNMSEGTVFDTWAINTDNEYAEEGAPRREIEERLVPSRIPSEPAIAGVS